MLIRLQFLGVEDNDKPLGQKCMRLALPSDGRMQDPSHSRHAAPDPIGQGEQLAIGPWIKSTRNCHDLQGYGVVRRKVWGPGRAEACWKGGMLA
ncbi:hypothetical protein PMIN01_01704 [Paraphaeosphaeria minitans]|uniref:Uncharacterized protein n=1 Tax=Paraphaeosphaeria minitans TaxID=565426 RepID=A0A9P6GRA6_9PLEO|nr:hypothetical protein PMIN01_01704 [Paraphaeosphaeria minitans]